MKLIEAINLYDNKTPIEIITDNSHYIINNGYFTKYDVNHLWNLEISSRYKENGILVINCQTDEYVEKFKGGKVNE